MVERTSRALNCGDLCYLGKVISIAHFKFILSRKGRTGAELSDIFENCVTYANYFYEGVREREGEVYLSGCFPVFCKDANDGR